MRGHAFVVGWPESSPGLQLFTWQLAPGASGTRALPCGARRKGTSLSLQAKPFGPMTWAAYGPQKPSAGDLFWHPASENDIDVIYIPAGQKLFDPASDGRPQQDSNLRSRLRRPPLQSSEFVRSTCLDSIACTPDGQDHSAYIPDHGNCPVTARTVQGMARVRSGQAPALLLSSDRSARRGSGVKHDLACPFT
jgi:hypothetical protein